MLLASASNNFKLWSVEDFSLQQTFPVTTEDSLSPVNLSWNKDGKFIATLNERNLSLYAVVSQSATCSDVISHFARPTCMKFSSKVSQFIAISVNDREVWVWDFKSKTKKKKFTLPSSVSSISKITFNHTDTHLAAGTSEGYGVLLSNSNNVINSPVKLFSLKASTTDIQFSLNNQFLIGACSDRGSISFLDTKRNTIVKCLDKAHYAPITGLAFSPVNDLLMSTVSFDQKFNSYNVNEKREIMSHKSTSPLSSLSFLPGGQQVALGTMRGEIMIHDLRRISIPVFTIQASNGPIYSLAMQPSINSATNKAKSGKVSTKSKLDFKSKANHEPTDIPQHKTNISQLSSSFIENKTNLSVGKVNESTIARSSQKPSSFHADGLEMLSPVNNKENKVPSSTDDQFKVTRAPGTPPKSSRMSDMFLSPIKNDSLPDIPTHEDSLDRSLKDFKKLHQQSPFGTKKILSNVETSLDKLNLSNMSILSENSKQESDCIYSTQREAQLESSVSEEIYRLPTFPHNQLEKESEHKDYSEPHTEVQSSKDSYENTDKSNGQSAGVVGSVNVELIRNCISDELSAMQFNINQRFINMHWNMIKYHLQLKREIVTTIQQHSLNEELLYENQQLKEEIKRLKATF